MVYMHPDPSGMKVVVLVSGGKDSILSLHLAHCLSFKIEALAHLSPRNGQVETDSYMYQSAGSSALTSIFHSCMPDIPFYSREVTGSPICIDSTDYSPTENDEVEDLFWLLREVTEKHSDIQGVVTGAIASSFQRFRVENCCRRLNLISIAPLWRWPQLFLLSHLLDFWDSHEFEVVLVKVATVGVGSDALLKNLESVSDCLLSAYTQYGINVCGEGGEFETLTLSCPAFASKVQIERWHSLHDSETACAASIAVIEGCSTIPHSPCQIPVSTLRERLDNSFKLRLLGNLFQTGLFYLFDTGLHEIQGDWDFSGQEPARHSPSSRIPRDSPWMLVEGRIRQLDTLPSNIKVLSYESTSFWNPRSLPNEVSALVGIVTSDDRATQLLTVRDMFGFLPHEPSGRMVPSLSNPEMRHCLVLELILCFRQFRNLVWDALGPEAARRVMRNDPTISINLVLAVDGSLRLTTALELALLEVVHQFFHSNLDWEPENQEAFRRWHLAGLFGDLLLAENRSYRSVRQCTETGGVDKPPKPWAIEIKSTACNLPDSARFALSTGQILVPL